MRANISKIYFNNITKANDRGDQENAHKVDSPLSLFKFCKGVPKKARNLMLLAWILNTWEEWAWLDNIIFN